MKKVLFLLMVVSSFVFSQNTIIGGPIRTYYIKGTPALGATYTNSSFDSSGTFVFGNLSRVALRVKSLDSTFMTVSLWRRYAGATSTAWTATDSVTIHPASGAGADTAWVLRSAVADLPTGTGTEYQLQFRHAASGNWATQATAASIKIWLEYVGH